MCLLTNKSQIGILLRELQSERKKCMDDCVENTNAETLLK